MKRIPYGWHTIDKEDIKAVVEVLQSKRLTQGPTIKEFEEALCKYTGAQYAVAASSGTAALHLACIATEIKKTDEIITSPITFVASANCAVYCGGTPVFADIQPDTVTIDPQEIKKKITKRTKAIIPVHFSGHPCDLREIKDIAKRYNLIIIEDACHALGAEYRGTKIGSCTYSDMTVFSFHPIKSITTGEGGAVLTNRKDLYEKLLLLRNHGITKENSEFRIQNSKLIDPWYYEMQELGFNYRITDFQCALGIAQLKKIDSFLQKRRRIAAIYNRELLHIEGINLPIEKPYVKSSWHLYCIRLSNTTQRRFVFNRLQQSGIGVQVHYIPVHLQPYYRKNFGYKKNDYPKAEDYYKTTITIPLFPRLDITAVHRIISKIKKVVKNA
ncbi:MAG: UDP-4-amino-4,6-dideoxy-N-acetyl-beta-L-altrosamine transaminase [Candidatus Omnitrophica bacterium CG07_land_8_20_14_0_80_42_15]|uniref:UDP-4-amino-4, 6-dideoxy-N-acetyl-beta-L-altrosamine transaminase n=1 Tax=Candidatus Aquitaenariimonas noxiae TaxID=1974741 RepID=A0A2J0KWY0_9BACT|nr:MAG: UDP-4-amino-4,6-dideoxy-N-acetyl-beta-L-altrosamine transaminase [Candidatus Omnitrophica bacterium CG07_land_8_20_14_0_80_42_15]